MSFSLLLLLGMGIADEPLKDLSEAEFYSLFSERGFARSSPGPGVKRMKSKKGELFLSGTFTASKPGESGVIGSATGWVEFDLPRPWSKRSALEWLQRQKLEGFSISSTLGGRLVLTGPLFQNGWTLPKFEKALETFLSAASKAALLAESLKGKRASIANGLGSAELDRSFQLDWVEEKDFLFLKERMGWKNADCGTGIREWIASAEIQGVPIFLSGYGSGPATHFGSSGTPSPSKLQRLQGRGVTINNWAEAYLSDTWVVIKRPLAIPSGITVKDLVGELMGFAARVKRLDIF